MKNHQQSNKYEIDQIFPIFDQLYLMVHLKGDKWEGRGEKIVTLVCEENSFQCIYKGFSIMNNQVAVKLVPVSKDENEVKKLFDFFRNQYSPKYLLLKEYI